ncbi:MAG TPA: tetratricopeptide repeat protein, partial [Anaerolineae bacterium]|nr:tetratricopeptide repeat protein [Anaerolineae bacterium]
MNTTLRALVNQAERLVRAEVYEEAIALCHAILRGYPRYVRGYRILAEAHLGLGNHGEAADLFRRTLGVDPEDPLGYAGLGIIFASRGLREEAIWQLERAFELAPGRDGLRGELARLYREQGMATQVQLTRAALARLYARGGLWNKAIGELRELVLREPYRLDLQASLVRTLWRAQRGDEAAEAARAVLGQAPNCLVARLVLGAYLCRQGHADEAQPLLQGAQELDPEGYEATRLLGAEWPRLLATAGLSATPAELAREAEDAEPPDTTSLAGATPAGETSLPSWLACDDEAGDAGAHIAMLPDGPIRA